MRIVPLYLSPRGLLVATAGFASTTFPGHIAAQQLSAAAPTGTAAETTMPAVHAAEGIILLGIVPGDAGLVATLQVTQADGKTQLVAARRGDAIPWHGSQLTDITTEGVQLTDGQDGSVRRLMSPGKNAAANSIGGPGPDDLAVRLQARRDAQLAAQGRGLGPPARAVPAAAAGMAGNPVIDFAARKKNAPVFTGLDPEKIEISDAIITQIMPLQNLDAVRTRNDISQLVSADADVSANPNSNCIIITDTSAHVHRMAEILQSLDKQAAGRPPAPAGPARGGVPQRTPIPAIPKSAAGGVLDARGTLAVAISEIRTPMDGTLAEINAKDGQGVKKGEVLFKLDSRQIEAELAAAQSQIQSAQLRLERAMAAGASTAEIDGCKVELAAAQALLAAKKLDLENCILRAPFDGIVAIDSVGASPTFRLVAGQYITRGMVLTRIADSGEMNVDFLVLAKDASSLRPGQTFTFKPAAMPDAHVEGEVTLIAPTVEHLLDPAGGASPDKPADVETVAIHGRITTRPDALKSGMAGSVTMVLGK